jgi:hypothetical protein
MTILPAAQTAALRARPAITQSVTRGAMRCLRALGHSVLAEVILASGRRADILALAPGGRILIVEVKSGFEDWRADAKWGDYAEYCDALAFAVAADAYGGAVIREPVETPLAPARRRAMLLRFASLAADRLQSLIDPVAEGIPR